MAAVGLLIAFLGFVLSVASLGLSSSNSSRLVIVLLGIAITLGGIIGVLNPAYQKNALWKK